MSFELPKGLPKLSDVTNVLMTPENQFQSMVKGATKVDLPPGPQSMLLKLQKSFEAGEAPGLPNPPEAPKIDKVLSALPTLLPLPPLPELPKIEEKPKGEVAGQLGGRQEVSIRVEKGVHGEAI